MEILAEEATIPLQIWIWLVGGALALVVSLVGVLGKMMLNTMKKINDDLSATRLHIAEKMITWEKFGPVKREMEKDREVQIELGLSKHTQAFKHEKRVG